MSVRVLHGNDVMSDVQEESEVPILGLRVLLAPERTSMNEDLPAPVKPTTRKLNDLVDASGVLLCGSEVLSV